MKYCTNCGKEIPENAMFCPDCGAASLEYQPTDETGMSTMAAPSIKQGPFSFSGRARRRDYWMFQLASSLFVVPTSFLFYYLRETDPSALFGPLGYLSYGFLPVFIMQLAVQVRRCHDLGWSGWFVLYAAILCVVPSVGLFIYLLFLIALGCLDGQPGPNRFGPDPKGRPAPYRDGTLL